MAKRKRRKFLRTKITKLFKRKLVALKIRVIRFVTLNITDSSLCIVMLISILVKLCGFTLEKLVTYHTIQI